MYPELAAHLRPFNVNVALLPIGGRQFSVSEAAQLAADIGAKWWFRCITKIHRDIGERVRHAHAGPPARSSSSKCSSAAKSGPYRKSEAAMLIIPRTRAARPARRGTAGSAACRPQIRPRARTRRCRRRNSSGVPRDPRPLKNWITNHHSRNDAGISRVVTKMKIRPASRSARAET